MDNQVVDTPVRKRGIVVGFATLPEKLLFNMRLDVGLNMKVDFLRFLQRHYKEVEKRDPNLDELYFLDRYLNILGYGASPVGEVLTDTPFLAETYADLMAKRNAVKRNSDAPSLAELTGVAGRYLTRSGKLSPFGESAALSAGEMSDLRLILSGCMPRVLTDDSAVGEKKRRGALPVPTPGNILAVLSPSVGMTGAEFTRALGRAVLTPSGAALYRGELIGETGVVGAVSKLSCGATIDLNSVPGVLPGSELTELCDAAHGSVLAVVDQIYFRDFAAAAGNEKIWFNIIGSVSHTDTLVVMHDSASPMSLNMSLIRSLARHTGEKFLLRRQARGASASAGTGSSRCYDAESKLLLTTATGNTLSDPFFMSLDAVLTAAAQCVAGGAEFTDIALSFSAGIPGASAARDMSDPQPGGDALSLILGAYRAQIEYCLPDTGSVYTYSGMHYSFIVSAAAKLNSNPVSAHFIAPGNGVYLLAPAYGPDGLPDFEDLRRMWRYVASLCRDGRVASAYALGSLGAAETLRKMTGGDIDFIASNDISDNILRAPAPGGIIIESGSQIEGVLIGRTEPMVRFSSI